jgi:4-hydroxy-3-methylbut-2-en-1-yl diphosphate synthase IspG/GcpE
MENIQESQASMVRKVVENIYETNKKVRIGAAAGSSAN